MKRTADERAGTAWRWSIERRQTSVQAIQAAGERERLDTNDEIEESLVAARIEESTDTDAHAVK